MILNDLKTLILKNYLILILILSIIFIIYLFIPISNPFISYEGISNDFNLNGKNSFIILDAENIYINSNTIVFRDVKNIKKDGIAINGSSIQVEINNKNAFESISNANLRIKFNNFKTIRKKNNNISYLSLEGNINNSYHEVLKSSGDQITLSHTNSIESISIKGEEISNFSYISFEFDNSSSADFPSDIIRIEALGVNEYEIFPGEFSNISLHSSDGILWVNDRMYNTKGTNFKFEMEPIHDTSIYSTNSGINFEGYVNSGKINNKNILNSKFSYWFDQQPEKINALAALILAIITGCYVIITKEILYYTKVSIKQSETNVLQSEKILEQTKIEKIFDNNEKLLMHVYSPIDVILTKFKLSLEYILQSKNTHEIPNGYNSLFKETNDNLLDIKINYGYLFDQDIIQLHNKVWILWKQYLNSDSSERIGKYETLNLRINELHDLISDKIKEAKEKREEINQSLLN